MRKIILIATIVLSVLMPFFVSAQEHEHKDGEKHAESESAKPEEKTEKKEESSQVGPNKGITEADEKVGVKLSPQAEKNFEIKRIKVSANGTVTVPKEAIVTTVAESNLFRFRNGFYKRIDFQEVSRSQNNVTVKSNELNSTDEVVVQGLGFLHTAEFSAFSGETGHGH